MDPRIAFGWLIIIAILIIVVYNLFFRYLGCNKPVQAKVVDYRHVVHDDDFLGNIIHHSYIIVEYEYNGHRYKEEVIGLKVQEARYKYPINSTLTVYLDPSYPRSVAPSKEDRIKSFFI